jgi:hypothetical protein
MALNLKKAKAIKYETKTAVLVDYDDDMVLSSKDNAVAHLIKAISGEFPQVSELTISDSKYTHYIPEVSVVTVAKDLGLFE